MKSARALKKLKRLKLKVQQLTGGIGMKIRAPEELLLEVLEMVARTHDSN